MMNRCSNQKTVMSKKFMIFNSDQWFEPVLICFLDPWGLPRFASVDGPEHLIYENILGCLKSEEAWVQSKKFSSAAVLFMPIPYGNLGTCVYVTRHKFKLIILKCKHTIFGSKTFVLTTLHGHTVLRVNAVVSGLSVGKYLLILTKIFTLKIYKI